MFAQTAGDLLDLCQEHLADRVRVRDVHGKGLLLADRLGAAVRDDPSLVPAACEAHDPGSIDSQNLLEHLKRTSRKVAEGQYTDVSEPLFSYRPHPPHPADRKRVDGLLDRIGVDHGQAIGLVKIRRELGQELVRRHAHGGGQPELGFDAAPDRLCDDAARSMETL